MIYLFYMTLNNICFQIYVIEIKNLTVHNIRVLKKIVILQN